MQIKAEGLNDEADYMDEGTDMVNVPDYSNLQIKTQGNELSESQVQRIIADQQNFMDIEEFNYQINQEDYSNYSGSQTAEDQMSRRQSWRNNQELVQRIKLYFQEYNRAEQESAPKPMSLKQFSRQTNIAYSTLNYIYKQWRQDPLLLQKSAVKRERKRSRSNVTINRKKRILDILEEHPYFTAKQIQRQLVKHDDCLGKDKTGEFVQQISAKAIYNILKQENMIFRRIKKVPLKRNSQQTIQNRTLYCRKIKLIASNPNANVFYIGQTYINLCVKRQKAWVKKGQQKMLSSADNNNQGKNLSVFAVIGKDGVVRSELLVKSARKKVLYSTLQKLFDHNLSKSEQKKYLIFDKNQFQQKQELIFFAKNFNFQLIFLPPDSPQLNPVQLFFNDLKANIRKKQFLTEKDLVKVTKEILAQFKFKKMRNYYAHVGHYIQKGFESRPF